MLIVLLQGLSFLCGLVSLVCFIMVIVQMFKRDESTMGIVCIVTILCCGIGSLIAFVYGWTKAAAWDIKNIMIVWTVVFVLNLVLFGLVVALQAGAVATDAGNFNFDPDSMEIEIDMDDTDFGIPEGFPEPEGTPTEQP
ncbi:MAG: hypothetical protein QF918_09090 [Pirellulaceae bacterium]|nr:hypothetical protein [Pirellulaceae bacterium]